MQNNVFFNFVPVKSPWRSTLLKTIKKAQSKIFCVSPFLTDDVLSSLEDIFRSKEYVSHSLIIHVLTRVRRDDFSSGASQLEALERILSWSRLFPNWHVELRAKDEIHAKVWIIDSDSAFVGSGNATYSGLGRNIEYGVAITNVNFIQFMQNDWLPIWSQSQLVTLADLQNMRTLLEEERTHPQIQELERTLTRLRKEVDQRSKLPARLGIGNSSSSTAPRDQPETSSKEPTNIPNKDSGEAITQDVPESSGPRETLQIAPAKSGELSLPKDTVQIKASELLQALYWMSPSIETEESLYTPPTGFTSNELSWRPDQNLLFFYAGRELRRSQAVIKARGNSDLMNWNIELEANTLKALQRELQALLFEHQEESYPQVLLSFESNDQTLVLSHFQGSERRTMRYNAHITHPSSKWRYWKQTSYRMTMRNTTLTKALIDLRNMLSEGTSVNPSELNLSDVNYGLQFTLYVGQKAPILREPILKIRREEDTEKVVEVTVEGNGKKYSSFMQPISRNISFNDLILALQGTPDQLRHWRILLDNDNLTEFDGVKNRQIVGLQPEKPPAYVENVPDLLTEWWHMLYSYWE